MTLFFRFLLDISEEIHAPVKENLAKANYFSVLVDVGHRHSYCGARIGIRAIPQQQSPAAKFLPFHRGCQVFGCQWCLRQHYVR